MGRDYSPRGDKARGGGAGQILNAADRLMLVAHDGMREIGHPGFQCQCHVWLRGRVDVGRLRCALERMGEVYPVATSRLDRGGKDGPIWRYREGAEVQLEEAMIAIDEGGGDTESAIRRAVWRHAERTWERPLDHERRDPISFHLCHLPDGRDVFFLQFSHVLMDGKAPELVLHEIDRLFGADGGEVDSGGDGGSGGAGGDEMRAHLRGFGRRKRLRSALRVVGRQIRSPGRSVTMALPEKTDWVIGPFRIGMRVLDSGQTERLTARVKQLCGFSNLSPAVAASAFRVIDRLTPQGLPKRACYQTDVPLNLRPPGRIEPVFRNFMSFIQVHAKPEELGDRDELTRRLNASMRDQLRLGIELGNLQMMEVMSGLAGSLKRVLIDRMKRHPMTMGYGFLGPVFGGRERFCGIEAELVHTLNAGLSPPGVTIEANMHRGRLVLTNTYVSEAVPEASAEAVLSGIAADLIA